MEAINFKALIPIFPLPSAVLMPRAILPLHVFEERYRAMTRDLLSGPRLIAIALLKPGFESNYDKLDVGIHDIACVGRILKEERLSDGRFNFLVQGLVRARIIQEDRSRCYRRGRMRPLSPPRLPGEVEFEFRKEIRRLLTRTPLKEIAREGNWLDLFKCPDLSFSDVVDVLASAVLTCSDEKQQFLAEVRIDRRASCLCRRLSSLASTIELPLAYAKPSRSWPPQSCEN